MNLFRSLRVLVRNIEKLLDWVTDLVRGGKWSTLLILVDSLVILLFRPEEGICYQWLSTFLPNQYPIFFLIGVSSIVLLALIIKFFRLDQPISFNSIILSRIIGCSVLIVFILAVLTLLQPSINSNSYSLNDKLSWGEEFLIPQNPKCQNSRDNLTVNFRNNLKTSEGYYGEYVKNCSSEPEAQIYFSNTKALQTNNPIRIVVSIPIDRPDGIEDSQEILRGVALAQNEWNAKENRKLVVGITDDGYGKGDGDCGENRDKGECKKSKEVAERLVKQTNILGVIGHFSSDATAAAAKIYEKGSLVVISPTSTAVRTNSDCQTNTICLNSYVFRTSYNDSILIENLINVIKQGRGLTHPIKKAAVIYEGKNDYSILFKKTFSEHFIKEAGDGSIVNEQSDLQNSCNFSMQIGFDPKKCLESVKQADALLLVPSTKNASQVMEILKLNFMLKPPHILLGADSMYKYSFIRDKNKENQIKAEAEGMLIAIPWHINSAACSEKDSRFECKAAILFENLETSKNSNNLKRKLPYSINWRTATAFEATQVLSKGLEQTFDQKCKFNVFNINQCMRTKLRETLQDSTFEAEGILGDGKIKFDERGDRKHDSYPPVIVKVIQGEFQRIEF
jgi:branched-chain amino acid transport system substrate-binding protein